MPFAFSSHFLVDEFLAAADIKNRKKKKKKQAAKTTVNTEVDTDPNRAGSDKTKN